MLLPTFFVVISLGFRHSLRSRRNGGCHRSPLLSFCSSSTIPFPTAGGNGILRRGTSEIRVIRAICG